MPKRQHYAVVGGPDGKAAAVRAAIDAVHSVAVEFECDLPLSERAKWSTAVRDAAEKLALLSIETRGQSAEYRQTGVLRCSETGAWKAFATFAPYAYDSSVWDTDGRIVLSLNDEGQSCVIGDDYDIVEDLRARGVQLQLLT